MLISLSQTIEHHRPMAGTNIYILLSEQSHTCVNNLPRVVREAEWPGLEPETYTGSKSDALTTTPHARVGES